MKKEDTQPQHLMYTVSALFDGHAWMLGEADCGYCIMPPLIQFLTNADSSMFETAGCPTRHDAFWRATTSVKPLPYEAASVVGPCCPPHAAFICFAEQQLQHLRFLQFLLTTH